MTHKWFDINEENNDSDKEFDWQSEWKGMPEFIQNDMSPYKTVKIHFRNDEDMAEFFELIKQKQTKRNSYWYPEAKPRQVANKRYIDES